MFINPRHGLSFKTINGKAGILLAGALLSILFLSSMASAAVTIYYWTPSTGAIGSSGFTANWGSCGAQPTSYKVTTLNNTGFTCKSDYLTTRSTGDQFLAIRPTAYSVDTQIKGQPGATFYLEERSDRGSVTYRFELGYAKGGKFTPLGNVTQIVPKDVRKSYSINMSSISGTTPSGSSVALRVSVTSTSGEQRIYLGTDGGQSGSNSGRFYVDEMPAVTPTPLPTYQLSGYVTNKSSGAPVGATVTTNTSQTNSTDGTGYYSFSFSNGTYIITASKAGYSDNSTTQVIAGAAVSNVNITLTPAPTPTPTGQYLVKVSTNRYVVLDDPNEPSTAASGFFKPSDVRGGSYGKDYWSGESTTIRAVALVTDTNGTPKSGVIVNFTLRNPAGGTPINTASSTTNTDGVAYYSFNLNEQKYWGYWKIDASVGSTQGSASFALNFWGCGQCHGDENPGKWGTRYTPKSYYTMGYDFHKSQTKTWHTEPMTKGACIVCHQMYNGTPVNYKFTDNSNTFKVDNEYSPDWHTGKVTCAGCHAGSNISKTPQGKNPEIAGCYDTTGCHPKKNTNVGKKNSTTGYVVGGNYRTIYSAIPTNSAKAHTPNSVECIACHSAGHNVTKPYNVSSTSNTYTENEHCWACHTDRVGTHYGTSCVGCHSQNAHNISTEGGGPDCLSCHNTTGTAAHKVDGNAMNLGEHANLNSNATASGVSAANKKCWGCHQTGGKQPADMGDKYQNPYKCYDCHNATKPYSNVSSALTVSEHFKKGINIKAATSATDNSTSCIICHNLSEMKVSYTDNEYTNFSLPSHYGKNRGDLRTGGSTNCSYCHQNSNTAFYGAMANINNKSIANHSGLPTTPTCTNAGCHNSGKLHDSSLSKPISSNDSYCKTCHTTKSEHKTLYCTECHANNTEGSKAGREIHGIQYLLNNNTFSMSKTNAVDCTTCHRKSTVDGSIGMIPVKISDPLHHSDDVLNGSKWGYYWTSPIEACLYCHNDTRHNSTPLGRILQFAPDYKTYGLIGANTSCTNCHYKGDSNYTAMNSTFKSAGLNIPPEITNGTSWNGRTADYYNHSLTSYQDKDCKSCHGSLLKTNANMSELQHNVARGTAGGADCKACHDIDGSAGAGRLVNFSAMNSSDAIHKNLNSEAATTLSAENEKCWACHGNGSNPGNKHPSNYKNPYDCEDCHVQGAGQNLNFTPKAILNVSQHYWNGTNITTIVTSCNSCHNKTEMLVGINLDPDEPLASNNSGHYGKKRTDMAELAGTNSYCDYCHNTSTNNITFSIGDYNNSITNHSNLPTTPLCAYCHNTGRIHDYQLEKPVSSDALCKNCHGVSGPASLQNKSEHKALYCTECHANASNRSLAGRDIHGIKFIQKDNTFSQNRTNAVDCTTCHQSSMVDSSLGVFMPPKVNSPFHHSDNINNGSLWGNYWASPLGACLFCHSDTKHNQTPLGRPLNWNYVMNTSIGSGTNCADCHYKGDSNYNAVSAAFTSAGLPKPPEITNGSWQGKPGYYNHSFNTYTDSQCKGCHDISGSITVAQLIHNVAVGISGDADCISCHYIGSSYHNIDTVAANASVHFGMNSNNATSAGLAAIDGACWACHDTDGNVSNNPSNQIMGDIYYTPKKCDDCHLASGAYYLQSVTWGGPTVSEHYYNGSQIKAGNSNSNIASCINCHENVSEMILNNNDPDYGSFAGDGIRLTGGNMSFYHYGKSRRNLRTWDPGESENCSYCHQNTSTAFATGMLNSGYSSSIQNHSRTQASAGCYYCHNSGWIHNSTLTRPAFNSSSTATVCHYCHGNTQTHNSTLDCSNCHIDRNSRDTIHPIKYIQNSGTFDINRTQAANCINCHQGTGLIGFAGAPKVPEPVNHSTTLSAGQKWGNYWDNNSAITACYYCHQNEIHKNNSDLLGNVSTIRGSNTLNNPDLANSTWCANCHYAGAGAQEYKGNQLANPPPEITNLSLVASDGTIFFNHSGISNFNASNCKNCHGQALSGYSETSLNLSHSVSVGSVDNCIECHGTNYIGASPSVTRTFVNISAFNESIHQDINNTPSATLNNLDCWECHYNKDMNRQNVKKCGDCHRKPSQWHGNANITTNLSEL